MVGSKRLTSPGRVSFTSSPCVGVGPDSRVASAKTDLLGRVLRPWELQELVFVILSDIFTTIKSSESSYLKGEVKFQPSIQLVALINFTGQKKSTGNDKLNLTTTYENDIKQSATPTRICAAEMAVRYAALSACPKVHVCHFHSLGGAT